MSAITSPYFTDELAAFLKEKGVLEKAEQRAKDYQFTWGGGISDSLIHAFIFDDTLEGFDYWNDLNDEHAKSLKQ